jgi:hypothetical protein
MRSSHVEALLAAVDALARIDPEALSAAELQALVAAVGPQVDRLTGVVSTAVGALHVRTGGTVSSTPADDGGAGPAVAVRHWLRETLGCGGPAAGAHVRTALSLRELPLVAAAVRDGTVKAEQARILTRFLGCVDLEHLQRSQTAMVEVARRCGPQELAVWVRHMIATWCEPQHEHDVRAAQAKRYLQTREQGDGTTRGSFLLPTESMEAFFTVLEPLARANVLDDARSAGQRRADALVEVFDQAARWGELPESGGVRTQVHYVVPAGWAAGEAPPPFADLVAASLPVGLAQMDGRGAATPPDAACAVGVWTGPATRARIEAVLCDAAISRVLLQPSGQIANLESLHGEITRSQRRALIARDRGCAHRGCTRPPAFCDAHHLRHREDGGDTTLDNLVLLCRRHHLLWHQGRVRLRDLHIPWLTNACPGGADPPGRRDVDVPSEIPIVEK